MQSTEVVPCEVPDYLCGRISMDLLKEPVVSPQGHTYSIERLSSTAVALINNLFVVYNTHTEHYDGSYERSIILQHLQANGPVCPVTRGRNLARGCFVIL